MKNHTPKISIITPSFNQGEFLEDTIKSVINQNYPNLEYILIDGGSTDNSLEIIKKYEKYFSYWVSKKDKGQTDAINKGFKKATGDIIAWLNSDDFYYPGALNKIAEMYLSDSEAGLYIGNGAVADRNGNRIRKYSDDIIFDFDTLLKGSNYILQPSTFINAKAIKEVGYLDESLYYAMDLEYWFRVAKKFNVITINEELSAYRWYDDIKTKNGGIKRWVEQWQIMRRYSDLQITPGLLVEFFSVLQEKEVNDHLGFNVSEFAGNVRMQFYQVMQKLLDTNECIPKKGNGKIFSLGDKKNHLIENKNINIIKSTGSGLKIDIVMPAGHSWFVREGYAEALKHYEVLNKSFYTNPDNNRELYDYLKNPSSDFIFLMNTDWHAQYLHNNSDWQRRWNENKTSKILFSFECMNNPVIKNDKRWWNDNITAVNNAMKSVDAVVFAHEIDDELFAKYNLPILWQPFAIDEQLFPEPKKYSRRKQKGFFKGKTTPFYYESTYSNRRKLIDTLKNNSFIDVFDNYNHEDGTTKKRAINFINEMNDYKIVLGLPSLSPTMVVRPFEAMASGAVFFQNNVIGDKSQKLFTHGENILQYNEENPEELVKQIKYVLDNSEYGKKIAEAGYNEVITKHTIKHRVNEVLEWIENDFVNNISQKPNEKIQIRNKERKILIDGVIFQLQQKRPAGIYRVWQSLLNEISKTDLAKDILLLDRDNTAPDFPGIMKRNIFPFNEFHYEADSKYLQDICIEENAELFISTYYTAPLETHTVLMLHDFIPEIMKWDLSKSEWQNKLKTILKANAYLSVSESTKNDFNKLYNTQLKRKVYVVPNSVSDNFKVRTAEEIRDFNEKYGITKSYFMLTGYRGTYKNAIQFFKAFDLLKNKNEFEILFTGGMPEIEDEFLPYLNDVKYQVVYLSDDELSIAYAGAVALVYPSKYEGFGLPILEAMKSGCPVITCKNSSIPEVAGDAALYVKEDDVQSMKQALININNEQVRKKIIKKGFQNTRFSWSKSASLLIDALSEIKDSLKNLSPNISQSLDTVNLLFYTILKDQELGNAFAAIQKQMFLGEKGDVEIIIESEKVLLDLDEKFFSKYKIEDIGENKDLYFCYLAGLNFRKQKLFHKAANAFWLAISLGLTHWRVGLLLAEQALIAGNKKLAKEVLLKVLEAKPDYSEAKDLLVELEDNTTEKKETTFRVSAIVSTYNSEKFIRGCLDDLLQQTLYKKGELEIVVVNSNSQQNEDEIVKEYHEKFSNIKYIKTENRETVYQAWNRGIKEASGEYITNANADDRHRDDALEILAETLDANKNVSLVYADSIVTNQENATYGKVTPTGFLLWPDFDRENLFRICFVGPHPMWRKSLHDKYGYFDDKFKSAGDYEFWLRISDAEQFLHLPELLGLYLLSMTSVEHSDRSLSFNESEIAREKYWKSKEARPLPGGAYVVFYKRSKQYKNDPLISVIIPTCNRPDLLRNALESLVQQTFKNFEAVVINDGNSDISKIVDEFEGRIQFQFIHHLINRERSASGNDGIKIATGKYIAFLDDDNIFYPDHLEVISKHITFNDVVYTDAERAVQEKQGDSYITTSKYVLQSIDYDRNKLLLGSIAPLNCFVIKKTLLYDAGFFNEHLNVAEDWELLLRISSLTGFKHVNETTVAVSWRKDGTNTVSVHQKEFAEVRNMINRKYQSEIELILNKEEIISEFNTNLRNEEPVKERNNVYTNNKNKFTENMEKAISFINEKEFEHAYDSINQSLENFQPEDRNTTIALSQVLNLAGNVALMLNKIDEARSYFEKALNDDPTSSNACSGLAEILFIEQNYKAAKTMFEYAVDYNESNFSALEGLKKVNSVLTSFPDYKEEPVETGNKNLPEVPGNLVSDAYDLFKNTRYIESLDKLLTAEKYFNGHLSKPTNSALAAAFFNLKGYNYLGLNKTDKAKECFEHALNLDPNSSEACAGLGQYFYLAGNEEHSKVMFEFAVKNNPENSFAVEGLTKVNAILSLPEKHNSLVKDDTEKLRKNLGEILSSVFKLFELKKFEDALEVLKKTEQLFYSQLDVEAENHLISSYENLKGMILLALNKADEAQESFELALNINPVSSQACAGLGEVFFISGKDKEAKTMYEWAVKNNPENKFAIEGLSKINSLLGLGKTHTSLVEN